MIVLMSTDKDFPPEHSGSADYDTYVCDSVVYISLFVHSVCAAVPFPVSLSLCLCPVFIFWEQWRELRHFGRQGSG